MGVCVGVAAGVAVRHWQHNLRWQQGQVRRLVPEPEYTVRGVTLNRQGCSSLFTLSTRRQRGTQSLASPRAALTTRGSFDQQ